MNLRRDVLQPKLRGGEGREGKGQGDNLPLTRTRKVFLSLFIISMKGAKITSNLGEITSTGGTRMVTFCRLGGFNIVVHFETSGNWSFKILIVFLVAVAVIMRIFPPKLESSPLESAIAGRKACVVPFFSPQLTTVKNDES